MNGYGTIIAIYLKERFKICPHILGTAKICLVVLRAKLKLMTANEDKNALYVCAFEFGGDLCL